MTGGGKIPPLPLESGEQMPCYTVHAFFYLLQQRLLDTARGFSPSRPNAGRHHVQSLCQQTQPDSMDTACHILAHTARPHRSLSKRCSWPLPIQPPQIPPHGCQDCIHSTSLMSAYVNSDPESSSFLPSSATAGATTAPHTMSCNQTG